MQLIITEKLSSKLEQEENRSKNNDPKMESQFPNVKDEKTLKVLTAKIEELKKVQLNVNQTRKILLGTIQILHKQEGWVW